MDDSNNVCQCQILLTARGTKLKLGKLTCLLGIRELWGFCCKLAGHVINFCKFNKEVSSCEDYHFTLQSASEFSVILQAVQKSPLLQRATVSTVGFLPRNTSCGGGEVWSVSQHLTHSLQNFQAVINYLLPINTSKPVGYSLLKYFNWQKFYHFHCSAPQNSYKEPLALSFSLFIWKSMPWHTNNESSSV